MEYLTRKIFAAYPDIDQVTSIYREVRSRDPLVGDAGDGGGTKKVKKEQMTKAQKRAQWKKGGINEDDRERGWNWVDIVRHLSQTANSD